MAPQFVEKVTVHYANGTAVTYEGYGNANITGNAIPVSDRPVTPEPHDWMELHITLHLDEDRININIDDKDT
jgi:hypothetical protein